MTNTEGTDIRYTNHDAYRYRTREVYHRNLREALLCQRALRIYIPAGPYPGPLTDNDTLGRRGGCHQGNHEPYCPLSPYGNDNRELCYLFFLLLLGFY